MLPFSSSDIDYMQHAHTHAQEAYLHGEVPIGCVVVYEGSRVPENSPLFETSLPFPIVACGRNRTNESGNATRHAEIEAIESIWSRFCTDVQPHDTSQSTSYVSRSNMSGFLSVLSKCACYVTVEPCIMCMCALSEIGIKEVVFGCHNERFGGFDSTMNVFEHGYSPILVRHGLMKAESILLLRRFYLRENDRAPTPRKKGNRILKDV